MIVEVNPLHSEVCWEVHFDYQHPCDFVDGQLTLKSSSSLFIETMTVICSKSEARVLFLMRLSQHSSGKLASQIPATKNEVFINEE